MEVLNTIVETEEILYTVIGVVGGWIGLKAATIAKLKTGAKKAVQVAQNLDELTEDSLSNMMATSVSTALHQFAVDQAKRDTALWQSHNECHERIEQELKAIKDNQTGIVTQLIGVGSEIANLRGRIEGQGQ